MRSIGSAAANTACDNSDYSASMLRSPNLCETSNSPFQLTSQGSGMASQVGGHLCGIKIISHHIGSLKLHWLLGRLWLSAGHQPQEHRPETGAQQRLRKQAGIRQKVLVDREP